MNWFFLSLILFFFFDCEAKDYRYFNSEIKKICLKPEIAIPPSLPDTTIKKVSSINGRTFTYHFQIKSGSIDHIGVSIFPDELVFGYGSTGGIYRYLERKMLLYILSFEASYVTRDIFEDGAELLVNGEPISDKHFGDFIDVVSTGGSSIAIDVFSDSTYFKCRLRARKVDIFYTVKKTYNIICGVNKIEADMLLFDALSKYRIVDNRSKPIICDNLKIRDDSVYVIEGKHFLKTLSSAFYVFKRDSSFVPLFNPNYPVESFVTTVLRPSSVSPNIDVLLEHRQYRGARALGVSLRDLIEFFSKDHELFFGIEDSTKLLSGTLVAYNGELNYLHLFHFQTNYGILFSSHPEYFCQLYTFIPTFNVKNLFSAANIDESVRYKAKRP